MDDEDDVTSLLSSPTEPHAELARREARAKAEAILERLDLTKRAAFVMFEIDGTPCPEIAAELGVPVGTVYSRIHAPRQFFAAEVQREQEPYGGAHQ